MVNEHIGRLYTAFLNTTSTLDWVRFLDVVEELPAVAVHGRDAGKRGPAGLHGEGDGQVIFQKYDMPWPVKDREVLLHRTVRLDKRAKRMTATCEKRVEQKSAWHMWERSKVDQLRDLRRRRGFRGQNVPFENRTDSCA